MTRVLYRTALAVLMTSNAVGLALLIGNGHALPSLPACVALGYSGVVVLGYAVGAAVHAGRGNACRRKRHWGPAPRVRVERRDPRPDALAIAAYAAPGTGRRGRVADTLTIPAVESGLDLAAWGRHGYGDAA